MRPELLARLKEITPEERAILDGSAGVRRELYTSRREFVVDSDKLLEKGRLIEMRPHTRFAGFPCHRHNYVELVYMCSGSTSHIIDRSRSVVLREGDLLFLNQNVYHEILPAGEEDVAVNFIILPQFFDRPISMIERENVLRDFLVSTLAGEGARSSFLHIRAKGITPVENLMENMIWTLTEKRTGTNTIVQTSMGLLFMNLSAFAQAISGGDGRQEQDMVFAILKYIETHYKTGTLHEAAALTGRPDYEVSRLLKKHTGSGFKQLQQQRRMQQAAYLLANTSLSAQAVMEHIGYENSSYFYHRFRACYGCSPREYRRAGGREEKSWKSPQTRLKAPHNPDIL